MALAEALKEHKDMTQIAERDFPNERVGTEQFKERVVILHSCLKELAKKTEGKILRETGVAIENADIPTRIRQIYRLSTGRSQIPSNDRIRVIYSYQEENKREKSEARHGFSLWFPETDDSISQVSLNVSRRNRSKLIKSHREELPSWYTERYQITPWKFYAGGENYLSSHRAGLLDVLLINPEYKGFQLELLEELVSVFNTPFFIPRPAPKA